MKFLPTYRNIWNVSLPIILIGLSESIVELTDTIFLAHYGTTELAAIGIADSIYTLALFLSLGMVDGIQITIGRRSGENDNRAIGEVFNQGMLLLLVISAIMTPVILFLAPELTNLLLASTEIDDTVNIYLQITAYALIFQGLNLAYGAFFIGISKTRILISAALVLLISNVTLNYILIFGNFGSPELGMKGAAIASLSAEIITFIFLTGYILKSKFTKIYGIFRNIRWDRYLSNKLLDISLPVSFDALIEMTRWLLFIIMLEKLGEDTLAIANIIFSCYTLFIIPIDSISETVCTMTSNLLGQDRSHKIKTLIRKSIVLSGAAILPVILFTLIFPDVILSVFTTDISQINTSLNGLMVIALTTVLAVPAYIYYSTVAGTGDTRITLLIQIISTAITLVFAFYTIFIMPSSLEYILLAEAAGLISCWLLSWAWYKSGIWKRLEI